MPLDGKKGIILFTRQGIIINNNIRLIKKTVPPVTPGIGKRGKIILFKA
jgi:hypothetical protein